MVGGDKKEALLYELGDIARDRLAAYASELPSFERVVKAEDVLARRRAEMEKMEAGKNEAEDAFLHFVDEVQGERTKAEPLLSKWQKQISAAEARAEDPRQNLTRKRQETRQLRRDLAETEGTLQLSSANVPDPRQVEALRSQVQTLKANIARAHEETKELEKLLDSALIPTRGEPSEDALRAHRRLLDLEDEVAHRKAEKDKAVAGVDQRLILKIQEVKAAEDALEQALLSLGQEVYARRISDPALDPLYSRLDRG